MLCCLLEYANVLSYSYDPRFFLYLNHSGLSKTCPPLATHEEKSTLESQVNYSSSSPHSLQSVCSPFLTRSKNSECVPERQEFHKSNTGVGVFRVPKDDIYVWNDTWKCYEVHSKSSRAQWKDCKPKFTYCQVRLFLKKWKIKSPKWSMQTIQSMCPSDFVKL